MPTTTITTTTTTEAVLAVLGSGPTTAAEVADAAGIGRSTATKALGALAADSRVIRTPGGRQGGRRLPDRWALPALAPRAEGRKRGGTPEEESAPAESTSARLRKGELAVMVLAFLVDHLGEHSPSAVAKSLGRSAGAISNALGRLAEAGEVTQTSQHPRRFSAARDT